MKQGSASHSSVGSTKVEPRSQAVSPAGVSTLGEMRGNHVTDGRGDVPFKTLPIFQGQGLQAPMRGTTQHHCGSQGKHK